MSPLRLLILAILFYVIFRLLFGGKQKKHTVSQQENKTEKEKPVNDVLVEDPICKKLVPRQQAIQHHHADQIIYFCSKECCRKFINQQGESE
jgi:YHS domain-containing protein